MNFQPVIATYITTLNVSSGIALARKYGVSFTEAEANIILPFLKAHKNEINLENKNRLLFEGSRLVPPPTLKKVEQLLNRFL